MRFEDRLSVTTKTDECAKDCLLPPLALQTLVENAIKYGPLQNASAGRIALEATLHADHLVLVVGNTGTLHGNGAQNSIGLGLANLRTRLALLFGERASLELAQTSPSWVEARLILPVTL
jgi:LytS/YehU family sensor histidine kinase